MKKLTRFLLVFGLLGLALVCYSIGFKSGSMVLTALGLILELAFWFGIINTYPNNKAERNTSSDS
ncbi:MAG: hypothetical protein VW874_04975 [Gammaproteobacteria bacterium]|jgi:hypothetical protein